MSANKFNLELHTARLLLEEPFFAAISRVIPKRACDNILTAQVALNHVNGRYEMIYNADWFSKMSDAEVATVLKHELYHVIFEHLTSRHPSAPAQFDDKTWAKIRNYAQDLAINSHLDNLPDAPNGGKPLKPGRTCFRCEIENEYGEFIIDPNCPNHTFDEFPVGASMEHYIKLLIEMADEKDESGESTLDKLAEDGTLDDHSSQDNTPQDIKQLANERMKEVIKDAIKSCDRSDGWGSISSHYQEKIRKLIHNPLDWRKVLRYFVKTSQRSNKMSTIKRINKRYPYIHSGRKTSRTANVAVSIDQSASVDNKMLEAFFAELNKLSEIAEFTVIPFDHAIAEDKIYVWKKGQNRQAERVLSGGTCFDAPTKYVNDNKFDGHIILTDLCAPKPKPSKCQRMWITTPEYANRPYFATNERIISID